MICADSEETIVAVPVVVEPVEVQVPLRVVPVEVRDVAVAIGVPPENVWCTDRATVR